MNHTEQTKTYQQTAQEFAAAASRSMHEGARILMEYTYELEDRARSSTSKAFELALRNIGDALEGKAFFPQPQNGDDAKFPKIYAAIEQAGWQLGLK